MHDRERARAQFAAGEIDTGIQLMISKHAVAVLLTYDVGGKTLGRE